MKYDNAKTSNGALIAGIIVVGLAVVFSKPSSANEPFQHMSYETHHQREVEARGECEINGALGANVDACIAAYRCTNWGWWRKSSLTGNSHAKNWSN